MLDILAFSGFILLSGKEWGNSHVSKSIHSKQGG